ncbi:unnamed protein product [Clonostachys byssicola]|uniref:RNA-binding S4 domain-containing protein n=1 Tax=Clonostachys byssicola TaxID=160290 RepID=A0A9N9Y8R1_9HYPO|nr:unnamed protein product [Clonostachys byssicola]
MRKPKRFYSLNRPKVRQSWNKHNLYNLARMVGDQPPMNGMRTFFQQKWDAKARTRGYHGDHIPEKKWIRLFDRRLRSAVDMPPKYLALNDGSEQAAGRGSGLTTNQVSAENFWATAEVSNQFPDRVNHPRMRSASRLSKNTLLAQPLSNMTPYMQMTFAPLERRLDTAIFRALFASSVRQARQFVIHGAVKVNGKKMVHPSYQLNPGDMFQVDVEKVLYGTGQQKIPQESVRFKSRLEKAEEREEKAQAQLLKENSGEVESESAEEGSESAEGAKSATLSEDEQLALREQLLESLLVDVKMVLRDKTRMKLSAKDKSRLRVFRKSAAKFLARPEGSEIEADELIDELQTQMKSLNMYSYGKTRGEASEGAEEGEEVREPNEQQKQRINRALDIEGLDDKQKEMAIKVIGYEHLKKSELRNLADLLKQEAENPIDESKPYATPWRPRPFMSAFAFIPRYLEVNPNICAAVYLRHPVARKGLGEVPTPFPYFTSQLAHNWYLGRG